MQKTDFPYARVHYEIEYPTQFLDLTLYEHHYELVRSSEGWLEVAMNKWVRKTESCEVHVAYNTIEQTFGMNQWCKYNFLSAMWMDIERTAG